MSADETAIAKERPLPTPIGKVEAFYSNPSTIGAIDLAISDLKAVGAGGLEFFHQLNKAKDQLADYDALAASQSELSELLMVAYLEMDPENEFAQHVAAALTRAKEITK